MISVSTRARSKAVAPAARRQRAETSFGRKPIVGPRTETVSRRMLVMEVAVTRDFVLKSRANGVKVGALLARRYRMRRMMA